jgi:hypothetical protein
MAVERLNGLAPKFLTSTDCALVETPVTTTGVSKLIDEGVTERLGLATFPVTVVGESVSPVTNTVSPSSSVSVVVSAEGLTGEA